MAEIATEPGAGPRTGQNLNYAPPGAPDQGTKRAKPRSLVETQIAQQQDRGGIGIAGGSPQVLALDGLGDVERGFQKISAALPALAGPSSGIVANLRQVIPQAIADQLAGINTTGAGGPSTGTPAPPPPGPPPLAAASPPSVAAPTGAPMMGGPPAGP